MLPAMLRQLGRLKVAEFSGASAAERPICLPRGEAQTHTATADSRRPADEDRSGLEASPPWPRTAIAPISGGGDGGDGEDGKTLAKFPFPARSPSSLAPFAQAEQTKRAAAAAETSGTAASLRLAKANRGNDGGGPAPRPSSRRSPQPRCVARDASSGKRTGIGADAVDSHAIDSGESMLEPIEAGGELDSEELIGAEAQLAGEAGAELGP
jgi:hypothetical protein